VLGKRERRRSAISSSELGGIAVLRWSAGSYLTRPRQAPSRRAVTLAVFLTCLVLYNANCRLIGAGDTRPARLLPFAILTRGTLHLDTVGPHPADAHWLATRRGHVVSIYPIVLPVLTAPLFLPAAIAVTAVPTSHWRFETIGELTEKGVASLVAALSVVVVLLTLRQLTTERNSLILTAAYAFGTQTWSTSSQALWQHGMGQLLLALVLLLLVRFGASPRAAFAVGVLCGLTVFNRPPNALFALAIAAFFLVRGRGSRLRFGLGAAAASLPFLVYNLYFFARPLGGYQMLLGTTVFQHSIPDGVAALLVSPGKGLLVFAPFFLFLAAGRRFALGAAGPLPMLFLGIAFAAQLLLYGTTDWRAGWSYGPRFLTDALPFLTIALVSPLERLLHPLPRMLFVVCLVFGFFVQAVGVFCFPKGGSYLLSKEQFWKPSGAQFLVEAKAGLARPDYLVRAAQWIGRTRSGHRPAPPPRSASFYTVAPCRAVDTRLPPGPFGGPPVEANGKRSFTLAGRCGIPAAAKAVALNVTVLDAEAPGQLTLHGGLETPLASAISYRSRAARANNGVFPLGSGGTLTVSCEQNSGGVNVLLDVSGYFE
jgi:hypothetical protein